MEGAASAGGDKNELLSLLQRCKAGSSWEERLNICQELLSLVQSQRVRDDVVNKLPVEVYAFLVESIRLGWQQPGEKYAQACWTGIVGLPEFEVAAADEVLDDGFLAELCARFQAGVANEREFLRDTLHWAYASFPLKRRLLRDKIGAVLGFFARAPSRNFHIAELLQVLQLIIKGFSSLTNVHRALLTDVLLPLHEPNQMAVWSLQQPLIESYHEALLGCVVPFLELQPDLAEVVFKAIAAAWPRGFNSNTSKEVLLLHEVETLIKFVAPEACGAVLDVILPKILECLRVDHSRVVERALFIFKDDFFLDMLTANKDTTFLPLISALLRGGEPFWNPTVNKMTAHVLESLENKDSTVFAAACESLWGKESPPTSSSEEDPAVDREAPSQPQPKEGISLPPPTTLKGAMGSWRPSAGATAGTLGTTRNPPAAVTGVAPWAFQKPKPPTRLRAAGCVQTTADGAGSVKPPLQSLKRLRLDTLEHDVGALAPPHDSTSSSAASQRATGGSAAPYAPSGEAKGHDVSERRGGSVLNDVAVDVQDGPGLRKVREFILKIRPHEEDQSLGPSWQELQLQPTPTLLPDLRFHDLVFGHELGSGSFSVVKYARHITKGKSRSQWPEYAVKVISTTKIQELNYEKSVTNEIACLRMFGHPGIARLVSAFRWRDGAYLVLEYASRGDLHSHVKEHGSLSEASTRFVIGEVVAAVCSIHDAGFVFGDLKPENILITESGHVKVADFGACRPVSETASNALNRSRDALRTLRDGDWRVAAGLPPNPVYTLPFGAKDSDSDGESADGGNNREEGESRAEGTAAYMSPEVARGDKPGLGADAWALGCVTFLCLSGRPPIFAETDEIIMARVVRFSSANPGCNAGEGSNHPALPLAVSEPPRLLVRALMEPDLSTRLGVEHAAKHEFFVQGGVDVFSLHRQKPVELAQGSVAPTPNAAWSRRQNSMIWAPMPQAYRLDAISRDLAIIAETDVERAGAFRRHLGRIPDR